ncbi:MAG TPA: DNA replication/repair protein RecF [Solimonas sp.]|nr:DNA replication/repair protein RecF [Solimonas sp.]
MHVAQLRADNFRLLQNPSLQLHRRLNLFFGPNAAGKTSLLETVYCLGRAKSFRGNSPAEITGAAGKHWAVAGLVEQPSAPATVVKLRWTPDGTDMSVSTRLAPTVAELIRLVPVQVLDPAMHRLLQEGPAYRRSFLDWGVFHVEQEFFPAWRRFQRALRQRNAALRSGGGPAEIEAWEPELAQVGEQLHALREKHLGEIAARMQALAGELLGQAGWSFELQPGWPAGAGYAHALRAHRERDRQMRTTMVGPHRAELRIRQEARAVKNRISRGQQKLLIAAMLIAQSGRIAEFGGRAPVLLVDDFSAELAETFQQRLLAALAAYPGQVLLTSFERAGPLAKVAEGAVFHVEHGRIQPG